MVTKLIAAELATAAGCSMIITLGSKPQNIITIMNDLEFNQSISFGTLFIANECPINDRLWWIAHSLAVAGVLTVDAGAYKAITRKDRGSLFSAGIVQVQGQFNAQQCVSIMGCVETTNEQGIVSQEYVQVGKGIVNYSSIEIQRIMGIKSEKIVDVLGYMDSEHVIGRDNLVIFK